MTKAFHWTNRSVMAFAEVEDPVKAMEERTRELVLRAMDDGWTGPPFDPLALAQWLNMPVEARGDIPDARTVPDSGGRLLLEYNPMRPRGRLRFSIAHEIAHSLFADCAEEIRNRGGGTARASDNWQLEILCNIGAAEILMPLGSFSEFADKELSVRSMMELRKKFDVSVEACLIRLIKLSRTPCAAFCASKHGDGPYRIDYVIPAPGWSSPISAGQLVPEQSAVTDANAIGFTSVGREEWVPGQPLRVECVGLAPYPGQVMPRVVGLLLAEDTSRYQAPEITEVTGDALTPRGAGPKLIAHVIPDTAKPWGGAGFASQVRRSFPEVWNRFKRETIDARRTPTLGDVFAATIRDDVSVAHMVAQHGIGAARTQRLRYAALAQCLSEVRERAKQLGATVHMPRVGTGHGGANWDVVRELITEELVDKGIATTVYTLPD